MHPWTLFVFFFFLFGLYISFDVGHGGSRTAEYLKSNLFNNLSNHPDFIKDTKSAIGLWLVDFNF